MRSYAKWPTHTLMSIPHGGKKDQSSSQTIKSFHFFQSLGRLGKCKLIFIQNVNLWQSLSWKPICSTNNFSSVSEYSWWKLRPIMAKSWEPENTNFLVFGGILWKPRREPGQKPEYCDREVSAKPTIDPFKPTPGPPLSRLHYPLHRWCGWWWEWWWKL